MDTLLLIGKVLLLSFLVVGCGVVIITYARKRRAGVRPWRNPYAAPYLDIYSGGPPQIPPPPTVAERPAAGDPPAPGRV
ncbi:hypothetical protein A5714_03185 [Mycobacterium sp. E2462]|uniref:hypothetical protein n=1 Tax=unclassified Mycobacterium TaxID=2642494 RepID=UPI0007FEAEEB|nr:MULTISPECIES: hypothetical protein [unclassified Mycobacterium]OBG78350.1 hypothetical protein A5700_17205 [Mycobacterium sp. E1214]OBH22835.1 hypothetical protein A5693_12460 [Mycobacterium sp. E1319]OBI04381.1 hypothetical protein A5714_03185 [Mycobacterium sp. E2462]